MDHSHLLYKWLISVPCSLHCLCYGPCNLHQVYIREKKLAFNFSFTVNRYFNILVNNILDLEEDLDVAVRTIKESKEDELATVSFLIMTKGKMIGGLLFKVCLTVCLYVRPQSLTLSVTFDLYHVQCSNMVYLFL